MKHNQYSNILEYKTRTQFGSNRYSFASSPVMISVQTKDYISHVGSNQYANARQHTASPVTSKLQQVRHFCGTEANTESELVTTQYKKCLATYLTIRIQKWEQT